MGYYSQIPVEAAAERKCRPRQWGLKIMIGLVDQQDSVKNHNSSKAMAGAVVSILLDSRADGTASFRVATHAAALGVFCMWY